MLIWERIVDDCLYRVTYFCEEIGQHLDTESMVIAFCKKRQVEFVII